MDVDLYVGDIVVDQVSGEIGLLVVRYSLTNRGPEDPIALWAWDVYWIGKHINEDSRLQTWTEFGLTNIIQAGTFIHYKNI